MSKGYAVKFIDKKTKKILDISSDIGLEPILNIYGISINKTNSTENISSIMLVHAPDHILLTVADDVDFEIIKLN